MDTPFSRSRLNIYILTQISGIQTKYLNSWLFFKMSNRKIKKKTEFEQRDRLRYNYSPERHFYKNSTIFYGFY